MHETVNSLINLMNSWVWNTSIDRHADCESRYATEWGLRAVAGKFDRVSGMQLQQFRR